MIKKFLKILIHFFTGRTVKYAKYEGETMTVIWNDGTTDKFSGSCTVWYKEPLMKRCSTSTEGMLCDLWKYNQKWKGPYPDAHKAIT